MKCSDCPRFCQVDRQKEKGFCLAQNKIVVSKIIENFMWEEPCITGEKGTLAIFFAGCNLRCSFCQNYKISHQLVGDEFSPAQFRQKLESFCLENYSALELITPTHFSSLLLQAFEGFDCPIPVVWNSGGYENEQTIEKIAKFVDVFLPDFKYSDNTLANKLSLAPNYFEVATKAISTMARLKPNIWQNNKLKQGVLIRHLVLPQNVQNSIGVLNAIKKEVDRPLISLMSQFIPFGKPFDRKLLPLEYKIVVSHAKKLGLNHGYIQDLESAKSEFVPKF